MFSFFGWLRSQVKAAILGGVADAMGDLDTVGDVGQISDQLRQRLQALPPPSNGDGELVTKRRSRKED